MSEIYIAGLVSQSFWFIEMKKLLKLISDGMSEQEIKKICLEENLFGAAKEYRAKRIYGYLWNRAKNIDSVLANLFMDSDVATQKIINLIAIIKGDRLFFEFLYEIYREKAFLGVQYLENSDISIFFNNKETQSKEIAAWNDCTKRRLGSAYINFMCDANLLTVTGREKMITPPILDTRLQLYLESSGSGSIVKAITGVR